MGLAVHDPNPPLRREGVGYSCRLIEHFLLLRIVDLVVVVGTPHRLQVLSYEAHFRSHLLSDKRHEARDKGMRETRNAGDDQLKGKEHRLHEMT